MGIFFNRRQSKIENRATDVLCSREVDLLKQQTHRKVEEANESITKLNALLRANGITLDISIATGAHRRGR